MALPSVLPTRVVTETYTNALGSPSVGTVTFVPVAVAVAGGQVITRSPIPVVIDTSGQISVPLPVGDDPDLSSPMYIQVTESIATSTNQLGQVVTADTRSYVIQVPAGAGSVVLSSLPNVVPIPAPYVTSADFTAAIAASVAAAASSAASAVSSQASAASAALAASLVGAPADAAIAAALANPASLTSAAGSANYARPSQSTLPGPFVSRRAGSQGQNAVSTVGTSRLVHKIRVPVQFVRVLFCNFAVASGPDALPPGTVVFKAAIEDGAVVIPLTINGLRTFTLDAGFCWSDPVAISRAAGADLAVRTFLVSGAPYAVAVSDPAASEGFTATTDLTVPGAAAVTAAFTFVYGSAAIIGGNDPRVPVRSIGISGDSIAEGQGDTGGRDFGFVIRACDTALLPYFQATNAGERIEIIMAPGGYRYRMPLLAACTDVVCNQGRNDLNGGRTAAQIKADLLTFWTRLRGQGARTVAHTTITPYTDPTNTTLNAAANEPVRADVNAWLRAGAPIDSGTLGAVAVGTPGALLAGVSPHPLSKVHDSAGTVEGVGGLWLSAASADGLHPAASQNVLMAGAVNLAAQIALSP